MIHVLFVCHGNICRSTMAESIFFHLIDREGLTDRIFVSSAATHRDEIGNPPYPYAVRTLEAHGLKMVDHRARLLQKADGEKCDYIVGMDEENLTHMTRILGQEYRRKIFLLLDFTPSPRPIADPWYTRNFELSYEQITEGCEALLSFVKKNDLS